jgi:hypothetical protein
VLLGGESLLDELGHEGDAGEVLAEAVVEVVSDASLLGVGGVEELALEVTGFGLVGFGAALCGLEGMAEDADEGAFDEEEDESEALGGAGELEVVEGVHEEVAAADAGEGGGDEGGSEAAEPAADHDGGEGEDEGCFALGGGFEPGLEGELDGEGKSDGGEGDGVPEEGVVAAAVGHCGISIPDGDWDVGLSSCWFAKPQATWRAARRVGVLRRSKRVGRASVDARPWCGCNS